MPAGRTHNARAAALALALGVNGLLLALLLSSRDGTPPVQAAITAMIRFDPPPPLPPSARQLPSKPGGARGASKAAESSLPPPPIPPQAVAESPRGTSIDMPQIDWHAAALNAAQQMARKQELARANPLKSDPEVMVLPKNGGHEKGHVEHLEGGVTMTFDGDCIKTHDPQAKQPWALDRVEKFFGGSASARWSASSGGCRADQTSRHRAEALERAVKPRYLGGERPLPGEEESAAAIKIP